MERPLRHPAPPGAAQLFYEVLAEQDTSTRHRPEWRELSPEQQAECEAALEALRRRVEAIRAADAADSAS